MSLIYLLIITPRDPDSGAVVTSRLAQGGRAGFTQFGSVDWMVGLETPPAIAESLGFDGEGFGEGASASALEIVWRGNAARTAALARLYWRDAPFTLHVGPEGGADTEMTLLLSGRVVDIEAARGMIKFALADRSADLVKAVATAVFAGSGGIEGDAEIKGQHKWRGWGALWNVSVRSLVKAHNVYVCTDPSRQIVAFDQVYDRANAASALTLVAWAGTIDATLAALIASVAPQGGASVAPSISCLKWWHGNPGKLTCDIRGEVGTGYIDRPADIAAAIVAAGSTVGVDAPSLIAARAARNDDAGWLVTDTTTTVASAIGELLSGVSLWFALSPAGAVMLGSYEWGASVAEFTSAAREQTESYAPVDRVSVGYRKNQTVMARGDIAEVVFAADVSGLGALATKSSVDFKNEVIGDGKPEAFATSGSNLIFNGNAEGGDTAGWLLTDASSPAISFAVGAIARSGGFSFVIDKSGLDPSSRAGAVTRQIPVKPGEKYVINISIFGSSATPFGLFLYMHERIVSSPSGFIANGNGNSISYMVVDGPLAAGWTDYSRVYTVPAGIFFVSLGIYDWIGGPSLMRFEASIFKQSDAVLGNNILSQTGVIVTDAMALNALQQFAQISGPGTPEPNADVTMAILAPPDASVAYDYTPAVKIGQLPLDLNFKLIRGTGIDVTTAALWSVAIKSGSAAKTIGATTGTLNITDLSADTIFEVSATYLGTVRKASVKVERKIDDPPIMNGGGTGGGGGGTSTSTNAINATTSSSYGAANSPILTAAAGATGKVALSLPASFKRVTNGTSGAFGKWQWRAIGGTFNDVIIQAGVSPEIQSVSDATKSPAPEPENSSGVIDVSQTKTGLTPGVSYEFAPFLRGSVNVGLNWSGTASAVGS